MPRKVHFSTKDDVDLLRWCADRRHHHESQTNAQTRAPLSRRWPGPGETNDDPLENLRVDVHEPYILVALRGTCFRAKYRKQDAPWLATDEYGRKIRKRRSPQSNSEHSPGRLQMRRLVNSGGKTF